MDKTQLEKCSLCGLCRANCPVFKAELKESSSPRGKAIALKKDASADCTEIFYKCTLCKACTAECPAGVDMCLKQVREALVSAGKETEANKKMIENIRKYGNPFGEVKDGKPKELYCC
jgi:Fe-S oxidoreductase